jgi:hypothetical protein
MNLHTGLIAILVVTFFSGCAIQHPLTAEEFRLAVPGAFLAKVESYEVNRPFKEVAKTFKKMAPECLDVTIKSTSQTNTSYQVIVTNYNPTVITSDQKAELHVQFIHEKGVMKVSEMPEKGYYLMVVDATPIDSSTSKIVYYGPSKGYATLRKAIKGWATGKNVGCPDMTKI